MEKRRGDSTIVATAFYIPMASGKKSKTLLGFLAKNRKQLSFTLCGYVARMLDEKIRIIDDKADFAFQSLLT